MSKPRWSETEGREVVRRWLRSGQSMNAFARERGMNVQRLIYWRKRLEPESLGEERRGGARRLGAGSKLVPAVVIGTGCALSVRVRPLDGTGRHGPVSRRADAAPPSLRRYPADSPRTRQRRPGPFEQRRASARWRGGLAM